MSDTWPLGIMRRRAGGGEASVPIRPGSYEEVSRLLREGSRNGTVVVPMGGLSAVTGAVDLQPGQVGVDLAALNQVLEIDEHNLLARVQAGINGLQLEEALKARGLTLG
ncbi:MAG: FAD-dependent oxidoreductase, partial [Candidatus Dormibacteraeota bacterium]|nr:FAD-dependent oxidoreductase [Candidatus Dormibacteraeota bacterium]